MPSSSAAKSKNSHSSKPSGVSKGSLHSVPSTNKLTVPPAPNREPEKLTSFLQAGDIDVEGDTVMGEVDTGLPCIQLSCFDTPHGDSDSAPDLEMANNQAPPPVGGIVQPKKSKQSEQAVAGLFDYDTVMSDC